jgi:2-polyprenyl-3-methyl-5-hydroxy-6-metoxy-1,4-benzoquinol methylase
MPSGISAEAKIRAILHYEGRAEGYDRHVSWGPLRYLRRRERQAVLGLARLDDPEVRTVIDVGCGGGFYSRAAKRAGKWVHALDLAPGMVERLRGEVDEATVADLEALSLPRRYDVVLCCGVLDFAVRPEAAFSRLCALCAPGGRMVVLVPRAGPGCFPYLFEKRLAGLRVNAYRRAWLAERAVDHGLALAGAVYPLPTNQALLFRASRPVA